MLANPTNCAAIPSLCCGLMPEELVASIIVPMADCPCIVGDIRIVYKPETGRWRGSRQYSCSGVTGLTTVVVEVWCSLTPNIDWEASVTLFSSTCSGVPGGFGHGTLNRCFPFLMTVTVNPINVKCCRGGFDQGVSLGLVVTAPA